MSFTKQLLKKIAGPFSPDSKEEARDDALRHDVESRTLSRFDKRHGYLGSMAKGMGYGALASLPLATAAGAATYASSAGPHSADPSPLASAAGPIATGVMIGGAAGLLHKLLSRHAAKGHAEIAKKLRTSASNLPTEAQYQAQ